MRRLATLSSSLSVNPIEALVHCADINIQVGILALSHGKRFFAQTMMIGSILSDILLVSFPPSHVLIRNADQLRRCLAAAFSSLLSASLQ